MILSDSGKTNGFYYWNFFNNEGKIAITIFHDNLKEIQQIAAKYIGSSTNIFETKFEKFIRKATITPTLPLRNEPIIHEEIMKH